MLATPVIMPRQGQSVESCVIGTWYKRVGDRVAVGDDLFSYETDKAAFDESAKIEGEVLAIFFQENDDVPCLTTVCVIGEKGADISALDPRGATDVPAPAVAVEPQTTAAPTQTTAAPESAPTLLTGLSPRAKATARKHRVDLRLSLIHI